MHPETSPDRSTGRTTVISLALGALMAVVAIASPRWLPRWLFWPTGVARHLVMRFEPPGLEFPTRMQLVAVLLANWLWFSGLSLALLLTAIALRRRTLRRARP